jgi:hypothetical protein
LATPLVFCGSCATNTKPHHVACLTLASL